MTFAVPADINTSETAASGTTHTVALPANLAAGNLLTIAIAFSAARTATPPAGWTELLDNSDGTGNTGFWIAWKISDGTEGSSVNVTSSSATTSAHCSMRWTGAHASAAPEVGTVALVSTASYDVTSLTPSWGGADTVWVPIFNWKNTSRTISSWPTNYTANQTSKFNSAGGNNGVIAFATRNLNATSEDPGALTLSGTSNGQCILLAIRPAAGGAIITAGGGSYTFSGTAATLTKGHPVVASSGSYNFNGTVVAVKHSWKIAATAGAYNFTGTVAALRAAKKVVAAAGAYNFSGTSVALKINTPIVAGAGSYLFTGTAAALRINVPIIASAGSYTFTGTAAALKIARKVAAASGSYLFTGSAANLVKLSGKTILADSGAYNFTGTVVALKVAKKIAAGSGAYNFTGAAAALKASRKVAAGSGSYVFTGTAVGLTHGGMPPAQPFGGILLAGL